MAARSAKTVRVANVRIAKSREVAVGIGDFAAGDDWKSRAALIADALPRLEADGVLWEVLLFLKPANRLSRFARYRDSHGRPYRRGARHRCWVLRDPGHGQPQPLVLLDIGLAGYLDPPDGIARPDGLTYLSRSPLRRWPEAGSAGAPATAALRGYLDGALTRYWPGAWHT